MMRRSLYPALFVALMAMSCGAPSADETPHETPPQTRAALAAPPRTLGETGLYVDADRRALARGLIRFSPQYPLWTDGATKERYLALPPGTWIDASDPEAWRFPVGTRIWKEFSFGRPVETRFMELTTRGWTYATYVWSEDGSEAVLASESGLELALGDAGAAAARHSIPSRADCVACHGNAETPVLGFALLQLSPDRDPLAPHTAPARPGDADLPTLVSQGLLRGLPDSYLARPPRIEARSPLERAALGYLHGNCGGCHRGSGALAGLGMRLAHSPSEAGEPALVSTVDIASGFALPDAPTLPALRVAPGRPDASVLLARMRSRDPYSQMPPIGTHVVDDEAVQVVAAWIEAL